MQYLKVRVDVDSTYDELHKMFKHRSVVIAYWNSIVPPDHVEYIIGPLTGIGVDNWKARFDAVGCKYHAEVREDWLIERS